MSSHTDVAIVGAGMAGVTLARALADRGLATVLIDRQTHFPDLLRAEKIEPDQAEILRSLGQLELRSPPAPPIGPILDVTSQGVETVDTIEQYGVSYGDTVNSLRSDLPDSVLFRMAEVVSVAPDARAPSLRFADGGTLTSRLIVLASGGSDRLVAALGLSRRHRPDLRSLTYGFDVESPRNRDLQVRGLNFRVPPNPSKVDFLTLFRIGERLRANLFTQQDPRDAVVGTLKADLVSGLTALFPRLEEHLGAWRVTSKVQVVPTSYFRLLGVRSLPGVVAIGEEYQSVSPTTGMGLSKVLTDVDVLSSTCIDAWLAGGRIDRRALARFYANPRKKAADRRALGAWLYYRDLMRNEPVGIVERLRQKALLNGWIA